MSRTYKATGINLKSMPLGEADRLLTILTRERGLVRAVAHGARKAKSKLGGRSGLLVVNELLMAEGRSLDKISQAETLMSYPRLSQNLAKLTISQYWGELVLAQALSDQPQTELFDWLCQQLTALEQVDESGPSNPRSTVDYPLLHLFITGILQLLHWAGVTPQVYACCITQTPLDPSHQAIDWQVGFCPSSGGTVCLSAWDVADLYPSQSHSDQFIAADQSGQRYQSRHPRPHRLTTRTKLNAIDLQLLQALNRVVQSPEPSPPTSDIPVQDYPLAAWLSLERALRHYAQYHFEQPIRSAALIQTCFAP